MARHATGRTFEEYRTSQGSPEYLEALAQALKHGCYVRRSTRWHSLEVNQIQLAQRRAKYKRLVEDIQKGKKLEDESFDPVKRHPTLWELRLTWETNTPLRIYFTQSDLSEPTLLALEAHVKPIDASRSEIRRDQNSHMDVAARRWRERLRSQPGSASAGIDIDSSL